MLQELSEMIEEEIQKEVRQAKELMMGEPDRKVNYTPEQLNKFFQFKDLILSKIAPTFASKISDNIYCRFLQGFLWDQQEAATKMLKMLVNRVLTFRIGRRRSSCTIWFSKRSSRIS